jgi:hypothetical protein
MVISAADTKAIFRILADALPEDGQDLLTSIQIDEDPDAEQLEVRLETRDHAAISALREGSNGIELQILEATNRTNMSFSLREVRLIVFCIQCGLHWDHETESRKCRDQGHDHQLFGVHRHRDAVALPDGIKVIATSFDPADPYGRDRPPDFGLYLDSQWQPPWDHAHLDWPDFGVPSEVGPVLVALSVVQDRARAGQHVEIGCVGGHGRTGTALACLAVLGGTSPQEAVAWVRANYCSRAVETPEQAAFVSSLNLQ